jgi:hypothetical protein
MPKKAVLPWRPQPRPPYRYARPVRDSEYCQRVRRHPPSSLVPLIAATAARYWEPQSWIRDGHLKYTPWALADAARVSIASSNEYRGKPATERDLLEILAAYVAFLDPALRSQTDGPEEALSQYLLRASGEQLAWQEQDFADFARTAALLTQTTSNKPARVMSPGWESDILGCSLSDYVGIAQVLLGAAISSGGRFDPIWLDSESAAPIRRVISKDVFLHIVKAHFVTDVDGFRQLEREGHHSRNSELRRFEHNPLRSRPLLAGLGNCYLIPAPRAIIGKASPLGLYHTGIDHFGEAFAQDFGELLEQYVGRQLRLLPQATVLPEIMYKSGRGERTSVDWIVIFDDLILLVEVKSRRPTQDVRLASERRADELKRMLAHAYTQIDTTATLIAEGNPAFTAIPNNRPVLGLIITQEPFHTANAPFQRQHMPATAIPILMAGASELEGIVTVTDTLPSRLLREIAADPERSTWALQPALTGHEHTTNPILQSAWDSYPWARPNRHLREVAY